MIWLLASCVQTIANPCGAPEIEDPAFVTVLSDFQVGQLAVGSAEGQVGPGELVVSGDAVVRTAMGRVFVLDRGGSDTLTALDPDALGRPLWQLALPERANPHDLVAFEGRLWVSGFGTGALYGVTPDGVLDVTLDLAEGGENPDPDGLVVLDGHLWVALQHLEQEGSIVTSERGTLLQITGGEVVGSHEVGPNPRLFTDGEGLMVLTGLFDFPGTEPGRAFDGEAGWFTPGTWDPVLQEDGFDLFSVVFTDGGPVFLTVDVDARSQVVCPDGGVWRSDSWIIGATATDAGIVLGSRRDEAGLGAGTILFDSDACAPVDSEPRCTALEPAGFASLSR